MVGGIPHLCEGANNSRKFSAGGEFECLLETNETESIDHGFLQVIYDGQRDEQDETND